MLRSFTVFHLLLLLLLLSTEAKSQAIRYVWPRLVNYADILSGAERTALYFPLLKGKNVAVVTNQTGLVKSRHLVDTLIAAGINVVKIFTPEHGFRGDQDAGAWVENMRDKRTGLPVISLYGKHKKPKDGDLAGVEVILFDLQDVGVRFYTYISTMTYVMEAAAKNSIPVIVLDRPNPNGFYVDGPVLEPSHRSFVGLHPVPVVYGMTIGEYALMVNGEAWLENGLKCDLKIIPLKGYTRDMIFQLPVRPSPNLPDWKAVYLYPSLCFFEGTIVSVGRGTTKPFKIYGHPDLPQQGFSFTPVSMPGAALKPLHMNALCYGEDLSPVAKTFARNTPGLQLKWLQNAHRQLSAQHTFFNNYFDTLAGTKKLREQIVAGASDNSIRDSWKSDLEQFLTVRAKYLLYQDF